MQQPRFFWRMYAVVAAVIIIAVSVGAWLSIYTQRALLAERERERAVTAVEVVGASLQQQAANSDPRAMRAVFREVIHDRPEIMSAFIAEGTGKILVHSDAGREGQRVLDLVPAPAGVVTRAIAAAPDAPTLEVTLPLRITRQQDGSLRAQVRLQRATPDVVASSLPFAGAGLLLLAIAGIATAALSDGASPRAYASHFGGRNPPPTSAERESASVELFDTLPVGLLVLDDRMRTVRYANPYFRSLWGLPRATGNVAQPLHYEDVIAHCHLPADRDSNRAGLTEDTIRDDGRTIRRVALPPPAGAAPRAYLFEDATLRARADAALNSARDATVEAAQAKAAFLVNMAAEMRTPLLEMIDAARTLGAASTPASARAHTDRLIATSEGLLALMEKISDYLRVDAGAAKGDEDVDPYLLVADVIEPFAAIAAKKGIELAWWIDADVPTAMRGKGQQLREVLAKLIANAVRFTDSGEVCVAVSREPDRDGPTRVRFAVRDTGCGLDPAQHASLFRLDSDGRGGLGLLLCKQLIDAMHGKIGAERNPDRGSTFWLSVPLLSQPATVVPLPHDEGLLRSRRVMIVDDNATTRSILERQLKSWTIPHEAVGSGREALTRLRAAIDYGAPYALAIIDAVMPETTGMDLARAIRNEPALARLSILMLTPGTPSAESLGDIHVDAVLAKPVRPSRLYTCLAAILLANMKSAEGLRLRA